jgi:hypothetical protein
VQMRIEFFNFMPVRIHDVDLVSLWLAQVRGAVFSA